MFGDIQTALDPATLSRRLATRAAWVILAGTCLYGFVFGIWRAPLQGLYSAIKLPAVFFSVVLASGLINAMFAQLLGARLSFRQTIMAMLLALASSAALLGSLAPVVLFFLYQAPAPDPAAMSASIESSSAAHSMKTYWLILLTHIAIIGASGLTGYWRLFSMLRAAIGEPRVARRVLIAWTAISGFVGCEISWMFSPFLCKPYQKPHIFPQEYDEANFYERVGHAVWIMINEK